MVSSSSEREQGELVATVKRLEKDMEKVIGDSPTSHASRIGVLETDKTQRDTRTAVVQVIVGCLVSFVVWITGSGLAAKMDAMHHDMMTRRPASERTVAP